MTNLDNLLITTIEDSIKKQNPGAKDFSYTGQDVEYFEIRFKIGRKNHTIKISESLLKAYIAGDTKKMESLESDYVKMRLDFDDEVQERTKDIKEKYKPKFDEFNTKAEKLKENIDTKTKEFLVAKIDNYFNKS